MDYLVVKDHKERSLFFWIKDDQEKVYVSDEALFAEMQGAGQILGVEGRPVSPIEGEVFLDAAYRHFLRRGLKAERAYVGRCGLDNPYCLEGIV
jgi:hypothetical protein